MQFKVDTGADTNLLPLDLYHKVHPNVTAKLLKKDLLIHLFSYNDFENQALVYAPSKYVLKATALWSTFMS